MVPAANRTGGKMEATLSLYFVGALAVAFLGGILKSATKNNLRRYGLDALFGILYTVLALQWKSEPARMEIILGSVFFFAFVLIGFFAGKFISLQSESPYDK